MADFPPDWLALLPDVLPGFDPRSAPEPARSHPPALLAWLRTTGQLTAYQAEKLARGQGRALVVGPYRLLVPLARGGMGMVYLGAGTDGGPVAVKLLSPRRAAREPRTVARFRREQHVGTRLPAHPHLVRQLDYGISRGVEFLVLNHLPGRTVWQLMLAGPIPVGKACRAFADAAAGLHAAHAVGIVHRDVKPGNLLVGPTGRGTVLDFGLALLKGEPAADWRVVGGPRHTVGTFDYLPPEQAADAAAVGPAADLYALGGSLFAALAGRPPFVADTQAEKVAAHRAQVPPSVRQFNPAVPDRLAGLLNALLAKHPGGRPGSAAEVATALEEWADRPGDPVPDRPPLAVVIADAEASWADRAAGSRSNTLTVAAEVPPAAVRLSRRQAVGLAVGTGLAAAAAGWAGWRLR